MDVSPVGNASAKLILRVFVTWNNANALEVLQLDYRGVSLGHFVDFFSCLESIGLD